MSVPHVLILDHNPANHFKIAKGLSEIGFSSLNILFAHSGHEAVMKFDANSKNIKLILMNPDTPWLNDTSLKTGEHSFVGHIQTPCSFYNGGIAILSDKEMNCPETVHVDQAAEFISHYFPES